MKRVFQSLLCCVLLAHLGSAEAADSRKARAEAMAQRGRALVDAGRIAAGCEQFVSSQALDGRLDTLLDLADCYQRDGRTASAWHAFLEAEVLARGAEQASKAEGAAARAAALEPRLTRIVLIVPKGARLAGLTVKLGANTIPEADFGSGIAVDPRPEQLSAEAKGYRPWRVSVDLSERAGSEYLVHVPTLAIEPQARSRSHARAQFRTVGILSGGLGLAGIGAGAVFNALSKSSDDALSCAHGVYQCAPTHSNRSAYADAATASFAIGSALFATGVTLFVLAPSPDRQEQHALRVAAKVAGDGGRLQLEGAF